MKSILRVVLVCLPVSLCSAQEAIIPSDKFSIENGQKLFEDKCSRCHLFGKQKIGPSPAGITDKKPLDWLIAFIRSSQNVIAAGDVYANHLYENYNHMVMPDFQDLSEDEIFDLLAYIQQESLDPNHDYKPDSVNYYDEALLSKTQSGYAETQPSEVDYFTTRAPLEYSYDPASVQKGKELFLNQCASCHQLDKRTTGPPLASITDRMPLSWLLAFIKSPGTVLQQGDDYANFLASNYPLVMPDFGFLSDEEIVNILEYIRYETGAEIHTAGSHANTILFSEDTTPIPHTDPPTDNQPVDRPKPEPSESESSSSLLKMVGISLTVLLVALILILSWRIFKM